jgi:uncharacterized protein GlcG (DUF336 family)
MQGTSKAAREYSTAYAARARTACRVSSDNVTVAVVNERGRPVTCLRLSFGTV